MAAVHMNDSASPGCASLGVSALEARIAAASTAARDIQEQLQRREVEVRARAGDRCAAVRLREEVSRKNLAPLALEVCRLEAEACAEKEDASALQLALKRRRVEAAPEPVCPIMRASMSGFVCLNVGGKHFTTSAESLRDASPWFSMLLSGLCALHTDKDAVFFIDRDGTHFNVLLNYMELGLASARKHLACFSLRQRKELLEEASYFHLQELVGVIVEPAVGNTVAVCLPVKDLVAKSVSAPLLHNACGCCHAPGHCRDQPVGCNLLGRAIATCIVVEYRHQTRAVGSVFPELAGRESSKICQDPRWTVEFQGSMFCVGRDAFSNTGDAM